jgi:hypothetical protein
MLGCCDQSIQAVRATVSVAQAVDALLLQAFHTQTRSHNHPFRTYCGHMQYACRATSFHPGANPHLSLRDWTRNTEAGGMNAHNSMPARLYNT